MVIRQMIGVPETFRAVPERKRRIRKQPEPSETIVARLQQLHKAGIPAEMRLCKTTKEFYIVAKTTTPPEWI